MTRTTKAQRDKLKRLYAATKHDQDWQAHRDHGDDWIVGVPLEGWFRYQSVCGDASKACAALIVALRNALPALLDDLDAAEAERDNAHQRERNIFASLRETLGPDIGCGGGFVEILTGIEGLREQRDALEAKLADPRRVVIHETEVVATKDEIASLKARLADLSEADEELHTCRALVNATSENLSVDLERMVDDLADANEKAARSEKDSHSWYELYEETKAKLAALVEESRSAETILGNMAKETGRVFGRWEINHEPLRNDAQRMLRSFRAAIAAARGGAS